MLVSRIYNVFKIPFSRLVKARECMEKKLLINIHKHFGLKFEAFAGEKINVYYKIISLCERGEYIVGKGGNAGYQHFLLFSQCFLKFSLSAVLLRISLVNADRVHLTLKHLDKRSPSVTLLVGTKSIRINY